VTPVDFAKPKIAAKGDGSFVVRQAAFDYLTRSERVYESAPQPTRTQAIRLGHFWVRVTPR
jgi:hypothetical protein